MNRRNAAQLFFFGSIGVTSSVMVLSSLGWLWPQLPTAGELVPADYNSCTVQNLVFNGNNVAAGSTRLRVGQPCDVALQLKIIADRWQISGLTPRRTNADYKDQKPLLEVRLAFYERGFLGEIEQEKCWLQPKLGTDGCMHCQKKFSGISRRGQYQARVEVGEMPKGYPGKRGVDYPVHVICVFDLEVD
ncbi:MAG: hypothetical protein NT138_16550 [Planctomycetales bacterium]|nr:hypothetical protein [Planctomycetales bacterium]